MFNTFIDVSINSIIFRYILFYTHKYVSRESLYVCLYNKQNSFLWYSLVQLISPLRVYLNIMLAMGHVESLGHCFRLSMVNPGFCLIKSNCDGPSLKPPIPTNIFSCIGRVFPTVLWEVIFPSKVVPHFDT